MKSFFNRWIVSIRWETVCLFFLFIGLSFFACGSSEITPVDIYPEDMCAQCRMAVSDQAFASEIITAEGVVFKFDDLGCLERFKEKSTDLKIAATFVKDYQTKKWLPYERSTIVQTSIKTPMGSGKVALADSARAREYLKEYPAVE
ncbi:MAG: nitrous oxide reductase accessory protein NosL [candidate division KSB1 bacterium]|nr:nitrous oxide reductase accessory protein NosL [candidate division KSB1 bacterium]MDZ7367610.1 nitrous oxide reductase accessory protein NosL [candidate division KSB1 bacterium]MDZ7405402.1 nitrous oxide reductase accessory protein NosL [candidate division KSB1 bacterium]